MYYLQSKNDNDVSRETFLKHDDISRPPIIGQQKRSFLGEHQAVFFQRFFCGAQLTCYVSALHCHNRSLLFSQGGSNLQILF